MKAKYECKCKKSSVNFIEVGSNQNLWKDELMNCDRQVSNGDTIEYVCNDCSSKFHEIRKDQLATPVEIVSPIKVIPSEQYLLVVEDATHTRHYWHKSHKSDDGVEFKDGEYDGYSTNCEKNTCN